MGLARSPDTPAVTFNVTLRKADDVSLGLNLSRSDDDKSLGVEGVRAGGAVEAWNKQVAGSEKEILVGDRIVKVNASEDCGSMLDECTRKTLLKITVQRDRPAAVEASSNI